MNTPRPVTVVIPALNAAGTISLQIEALARQQGAPAFGVVVVDNGSDDSTADVARAAAVGRLELRVVHQPMRGVNRARNAGIAVAPEGVVLLCDADDRVSPNWVAALSAAVDHAHWAAGSVDYVSLNDGVTRRVWGAPDVGVPIVSDPYEDRTFGGPCGFTTQMWSALGGFDGELSGATDENEFFMRAYRAGFRPRVVADAVVAYRLRPGTRTWLRARYRSGRSQGQAARRTGGVHLVPLCRPPQSVLGVLKVVAAFPLYAWSGDRRRQWCGSVLRQIGRVIGWFSAGRATTTMGE